MVSSHLHCRREREAGMIPPSICSCTRGAGFPPALPSLLPAPLTLLGKKVRGSMAQQSGLPKSMPRAGSARRALERQVNPARRARSRPFRPQ